MKGVRYKADRMGSICEWTIGGKTDTKFFNHAPEQLSVRLKWRNLKGMVQNSVKKWLVLV